MRAWRIAFVAAWVGLACGLARRGRAEGLSEPARPAAPSSAEARRYAGVPSPQLVAKVGLQYYWPLRLDLEPREHLSRLWLVDQSLYALTSRNRLFAIDAVRGLVRWSRTVARPTATVFGVRHAEMVVIPRYEPGIRGVLDPKSERNMPPLRGVVVSMVGEALLLDAADGTLYRRIGFDDLAASATAGTDGAYVFAPATDGRYAAYRLREGIRVWTRAVDETILAPIEYYNGNLFVGGDQGTLEAVRATFEAPRVWQRKLGGAVLARMHVDARGCFVPCGDGRIYAFGSETGVSLWRPFVCEGILRAPVQVSDSTIFQLCDTGRFYAVKLDTGTQRWSRTDLRRVVGAFGGTAYVLDRHGRLAIVDEVLGETRGRLPTGALRVWASNTSQTALYAATPGGRVFCLRDEGAEPLTPEDMREGVKAVGLGAAAAGGASD